MSLNEKFLGKGLYTISESSRFTGINSQKISRILFGYKRRVQEELKQEASMWKSEFDVEDAKVLSFRDLIELRFMKKFQLAGLSPQKLRKVREKLIIETGKEYPFSSNILETDGVKMFFQEEIHNIVRTIEVFSGQKNFREVIKQSFKDIEYNEFGPERWWIKGQENGIVLDPNRSFGQPIDYASGVPTYAIAEYVSANNNNYQQAANDFGVPVKAVKRACEFETASAHESIH